MNKGARIRFKDAAVMTATTVGAGIFSLPYIFKEAGLFAGAFFLVILACLVVAVHVLYWEVLKKTGGTLRLVGLAQQYLGGGGFAAAFVAIVFGLILSLVAYIILGSGFLTLIFPKLSFWEAALLFWVGAVFPLFLRQKRFMGLELAGAWFIIVAIAFVFVRGFGNGGSTFISFPFLVPQKFFLPFGAILFSLAGWTAIKPLFDEEKKAGATPLVAAESLSLGTLFSAFLYAAFVGGILGSVSDIRPDTVSGLVMSGWGPWAVGIIGALGLFAIWTSYVPVSMEIRNSLERDCGWKKGTGLALVVALPLLLILAGLDNFLAVLGLAGGVFVSAQYLLILLLGMKVLKPTGASLVGFVLSSIVFALAAVWEIYIFLVG